MLQTYLLAKKLSGQLLLYIWSSNIQHNKKFKSGNENGEEIVFFSQQNSSHGLHKNQGWTQQDYPIQTILWPSGGLGTLNGKGNGKTAVVSYTILNHASKNRKVHTVAVGNTKLNWAGYGLDILD